MHRINMKSTGNKLLQNPITAPFIKPDFIKYCIIGVIGLIIELSIYYFCYRVIGIEYTWSHVISSHCAIIHNFILNSIFTFKITDKKMLRFLSYYGIALIGIVVGTFLLYIFTDIWEIHPMISKLLVLGIVTPIQFLFNKHLTFKKKTVDNKTNN